MYLYFRVLLPAAFRSRPPLLAALHVAGALWLASNVLINYALCIATDPGFPPQVLALDLISHAN